VSTIAIVTDSLAAMPMEPVRELGIRIVPVGITINGHAYHDDLDVHPTESIICLTVSKMMSATCQTASKGREMILNEKPGLRVEFDIILLSVLHKAPSMHLHQNRKVLNQFCVNTSVKTFLASHQIIL
jgi:fatty acid-binding protein DegV